MVVIIYSITIKDSGVELIVVVWEQRAVLYRIAGVYHSHVHWPPLPLLSAGSGDIVGDWCDLRVHSVGSLQSVGGLTCSFMGSASLGSEGLPYIISSLRFYRSVPRS